MHQYLRRRTMVGLATLVCVCVAIAAAARHSADAHNSARVVGVGHQISSSYSLFTRRSHGRLRVDAVAAPPVAVQRSLQTQRTRLPSLGLTSSEVQAVTPAPNSTVWAQPGTNGMCATLSTSVVLPGSNVAHSISPSHCDETAGVSHYGLVSASTIGTSTFLAWGLVPDGNTSVSAKLADGTSQIIPVTTNAFSARTPSQVESLTFLNASGVSVTVSTAP